MTNDIEVKIRSLGAQGDGIGDLYGQEVFIPRALPEEIWRVLSTSDDVANQTFQLISASEKRRQPPCSHFGKCGGCMSQHMTPDLYTQWKHDIVTRAFQHRGINADVRPVITIAENSRRRAFLGVEKRGPNIIIGFRQENDHALVDMHECSVLEKEIVQTLPSLRTIAATAMKDHVGGRIVVTAVDQGLDVAFENARKDLSAEDHQALARLALSANLVRLSINGDTIVSAAEPTITIADIEIAAPIGVFLQAAKEAEAHLVDHVRAAIPKRANNAVDLFCGVGTLTFPLARRLTVTAFDGERRAVASLTNAAKHAKGLKPIDARVRDLFREPLSTRELNAFDVVVLDPPRAGAAEQTERLAKSKVPVIVAVSCNPATMARDAKALIAGGYKMDAVTPIDQFRYSHHVEAMTVFRR